MLILDELHMFLVAFLSAQTGALKNAFHFQILFCKKSVHEV